MWVSKSEPDVQLTDFAEEDEFESLLKELSTDVSAAEYVDFDREVVTSQPSINVKNSLATGISSECHWHCNGMPQWPSTSERYRKWWWGGDHWWFLGNKIDLRSTAVSRLNNAFYQAVWGWRNKLIVGSGNWKAAGNYDQIYTAKENNWLF